MTNTIESKVNPGEAALDQSNIHITHCLHFHRHYDSVYLSYQFPRCFCSLVHQMYAHADTKSLSTTFFQVFLGLPLGWATSTSSAKHILTGSPSSFRKTRPYYLNLLHRNMETLSSSRPNLSLGTTLEHLSIWHTTHVNLTIVISARAKASLFSFITDHV